MSRKDLWQSTARGGQNERVRTPIFLTMRDLRLACPRSEPRHASVSATCSQHAGAFPRVFSSKEKGGIFFASSSYEVWNRPFDTLNSPKRSYLVGQGHR